MRGRALLENFRRRELTEDELREKLNEATIRRGYGTIELPVGEVGEDFDIRDYVEGLPPAGPLP